MKDVVNIIHFLKRYFIASRFFVAFSICACRQAVYCRFLVIRSAVTGSMGNCSFLVFGITQTSDGSTFDKVYMPSIAYGLRYTVNNWLNIRTDYIDIGNAHYTFRWYLGVIVSY